ARITIPAEIATGCRLWPLFRRDRKPTELVIVTASRVPRLKRNCRSKWRIPAWDESAARTLVGFEPRCPRFDECAQDRQRQTFVLAFGHVVELGGNPDVFG